MKNWCSQAPQATIRLISLRCFSAAGGCVCAAGVPGMTPDAFASGSAALFLCPEIPGPGVWSPQRLLNGAVAEGASELWETVGATWGVVGGTRVWPGGSSAVSSRSPVTMAPPWAAAGAGLPHTRVSGEVTRESGGGAAGQGAQAPGSGTRCTGSSERVWGGGQKVGPWSSPRCPWGHGTLPPSTHPQPVSSPVYGSWLGRHD